MVSKKSFTLLVDTGTIPFFAVVPIISDGDCRQFVYSGYRYFPIYHPPEIIRAIVAVSAIMGPRRKMCINPGYCF